MTFRTLLRRTVAATFVLLFALALLVGPAGPTARAEDPVVHAVLFYSPACGHCHKVMTEDLPPLVEQHGDQLAIVAVDVTPAAGDALYQAAVVIYGLDDRRGVPTLVVGDVALVGSAEIPERFPGLVDDYLAAGGVDWPAIPGLAEAMATPEPATTADPSAAAPTASPAATASPAPAEPTAPDAGTGTGVPADDLVGRLGRDPLANALAIVVLATMLIVLAWAIVLALRAGDGLGTRPPSAAIAILAVVGLGVAGYLAFVETTEVLAVCGPVGDCNTVQQSEYARLFGVLPIGVLGVIGYVAILGAWIVARRPEPAVARPARLALFAMAVVGVLFSVYLTFLEPFVIGAVCAWCVTSAVVMTLVLVVAVRSIAGVRPEPAEAAPAA